MKSRLYIRSACVVAALMFFAVLPRSTEACRIIVPPWPPHPPPVQPPHIPSVKPMEVKSHKVNVEIDENVATVSLQAVFHNPNPSRIEGTYLFPIGPKAVVSSFAMTVNGKTMEAELLEAGKARDIYESIVRKMKDPALLEYVEQGLLRARVFPIEANADVRVDLVYEEAVDRDSGVARFSYPLLSVKPDPGVAIQNLLVEITLKTSTSLKTVLTPGFDAKITRPNGETATVVYETTKHVPDRDFEVVFSEDRKQVGVSFLATKKNGEGYFMLVVAPNSELQMEEIATKDITFVIDTSGSMAGEKMRQAKAALKFCVENLGKKDYFNIVAFATDVLPLKQTPLPFDEKSRQEAVTFIDELKPRGGTAISDALAFAVKSPVAKDHVGMVVFITDGLPTIGETDPNKILGDFAQPGDRRLFTFGVGYDVNTRLLDGLAAAAEGYASYVRPKEDLELALSAFYEKVAYPVLTDLQLDAGKVKLAQMNPKKLPGLFKGAQLIITGRYEGKGNQQMVLSGEIGGAREKFIVDADLDGTPRNSFIPRLWAMGRVAHLQEQIRINGRSDELVNEIKLLGRQYGILTEYTSFLVVEEGIETERIENARLHFRRLEEAAEMDAGAAAVDSARSTGKMKGDWGMAAPSATTFARESKSIGGAYQAAGIKLDHLDELVRNVRGKTFYYRRAQDTWYDSEIISGSTPDLDIEVKAWSDEFFELIAKHPELAGYLLGGDLRQVIKLGDLTIRIN